MSGRPLRVVITAVQYYRDYPSGSSRLACDEALFLATQGHDVWIVTQDPSESKPEHTVETGIHILRYPSPRLSALDPRRMRVHQERTSSLLARYLPGGVDLIHGHSLLQYDGALALQGAGARTCYSVHSPVKAEMIAEARSVSLTKRVRLSITAYLTNRIERRCLNRSDCLTAFSDYTRTRLKEIHGPVLAGKVRVIPGWVDLRRYQIAPDRGELKARLGWPADAPIFFTLRRLVSRMGLDRMLHAVAMLKRDGKAFYLVIGGGGPLRPQLEALVRQLDLDNIVSFVGRVPDEVLPQYYAAADAFVLPTADLECFGLIAIESLACGRPVLATPTGAIPEVMRNFEPRWLARDATAYAIADMLDAFLRSDLPSHPPDHLRSIVERLYSQSSVLPKLVDVAQGRASWDVNGSVATSTAHLG